MRMPAAPARRGRRGPRPRRAPSPRPRRWRRPLPPGSLRSHRARRGREARSSASAPLRRPHPQAARPHRRRDAAHQGSLVDLDGPRATCHLRIVRVPESRRRPSLVGGLLRRTGRAGLAGASSASGSSSASSRSSSRTSRLSTDRAVSVSPNLARRSVRSAARRRARGDWSGTTGPLSTHLPSTNTARAPAA